MEVLIPCDIVSRHVGAGELGVRRHCERSRILAPLGYVRYCVRSYGRQRFVSNVTSIVRIDRAAALFSRSFRVRRGSCKKLQPPPIRSFVTICFWESGGRNLCLNFSLVFDSQWTQTSRIGSSSTPEFDNFPFFDYVQ